MIVASVNAEDRAITNRSMMVTALRSEGSSFMPQYRAVSTDAPMPMPMQKIWNRLMNCPPSADAESCASPMELSISVSIRFTPTVISCCAEMGRAMAAIFL